MQSDKLKKTLFVGFALAILMVPTLALAEGIGPTSAGTRDIIPISYGPAKHWAEVYVKQLIEQFDVQSYFVDKELDDTIDAEGFQGLVKLILDKEYGGTPDTITREAVVYELTNIWAQKTGQRLGEIPIIKMLVYSDTDKMDAKYMQGLTLAYMKGIAKGRGKGIFDPKADVTYGEFAALICNTLEAIKNEIGAEDEFEIKNKFETRGSYDIKDDKIVFNFELVNLYDDIKEVMFSSGQQFELTITDDKGRGVYRFSEGKFFTMALIFKSIGPGEAMRWQDEWDMTDKSGKKLTSGKYEALIQILAKPQGKGEPIKPEELTTTIEFNLNKQ